jgi:predicted metalloprotease with PDZ domain
MALLEGQSGPVAVLWRDFGVRTREPRELEVKVLRLPGGGVFVSEVRKGSRAATIGIRPGDLLISSGGTALERPEDLLSLNGILMLVREGRKLEVATRPDFALDRNATHPQLTALDDKSRLYAAGLRPGDAIVRIAAVDDPPMATITKLLSRSQPVFVIYERDDRHVGVLLP